MFSLDSIFFPSINELLSFHPLNSPIPPHTEQFERYPKKPRGQCTVVRWINRSS